MISFVPFLALLFAAGPEHALQQQGPARLLVQAERTDGQIVIKFSELLYLTVRIEGTRDLKVEVPSSWTKSPAWRVSGTNKPIVRTSGEGKASWEASFALDPLAPGVHAVELEPLRYRDGQASWQTVSWQPFAVNVIPQIRDPDRQNLREHTSIEDLPTLPPSATSPWIWLGAALALMAIGWFVVRRRDQARARRSPREAALYELDRLARLRLPEQGRVEEFHTLLANVVRKFLEKTHGLPARHLTTEEFLNRSREATDLSEKSKNFLELFLRRCDLAKFAQAQVSAEECQALLNETRRFIHDPTEPDA